MPPSARRLRIKAKYSREFETEADEFALAYLAKKGIAPDAFSALLERLERAEGTTAGLDYFSTHPATRDMVATRGRASFLGERSRGHEDPGAASATLLVEAVCGALGGRA